MTKQKGNIATVSATEQGIRFSEQANEEENPSTEKEEDETIISWTSSNVSLTPENPLYHNTTTNDTTRMESDNLIPSQAKDQNASMANSHPLKQTGGDTDGRGGEGGEGERQQEEAPQQLPLIKRTSAQEQQTLGETAAADSVLVASTMNTTPSTTMHQYQVDHHQTVFEEDEHGEPVVDEHILQSLVAARDENEDDHGDDPLMLEESSSQPDDDDDILCGGGARKSFLPFHPPPAEPASLSASLPTSPVRGKEEESENEDKFDFAFDVNATSADEEDDDQDDVFLQNNSLLPHRRLPSTIVEEFSESFASKKDGEDLVKQQQEPLLESSASPLSEMSQRACSSTGSLGGLLRKVSSSNSLGGLQQTTTTDSSSDGPLGLSSSRLRRSKTEPADPLEFTPFYKATRVISRISRLVLPKQHLRGSGAATWIGFWALLHVTCANYVLTPMRDAIALQVGVQHMPQLTLASTVLALFSSVPIGWLFEAPDPGRRKLWKRMGLTRGETQGSSLALFYRCFAFILISYAVGFQFVETIRSPEGDETEVADRVAFGWLNLTTLWASLGKAMYVAFFLVVHLMKLHCLSLVWGVTTEAMEYEDVARKHSKMSFAIESHKMRLQRLALVGFGGTLGGIAGSFLASSMAQILRLPGLLFLAAGLLEISAELSIELGRIMKKHWEGQQQLFQSSSDLASLDPSMKRSSSLGSMKRISSGNSLNRVQSTSDLGNKNVSNSNLSSASGISTESETVNEDTFTQRLMRGITTILRSRLLMAIFTYNALYASTTVLLSFQRAALVVNRNDSTTVQADTAFLANINMASSVAIFALQASGIGAYVAHACGSRGTLALMPVIRLLGVLALAWWHRYSDGQPPNLMVFLVVDECCKIMNLAVAKPVRESLWRGLSNEARYEAKPIVDTLANRWGGGSAAFLVSFVDKTLDLFGVVALRADGVRNIFGFPPILFLCLIIATWWSMVSVDLGNIRKNIDLELKKRQ